MTKMKKKITKNQKIHPLKNPKNFTNLWNCQKQLRTSRNVKKNVLKSQEKNGNSQKMTKMKKKNTKHRQIHPLKFRKI